MQFKDMIRAHDGKWITIPPGHGWFEVRIDLDGALLPLQGDNADVSRDSNSYGPVRITFPLVEIADTPQLPLALITHKPYGAISVR